MAEPPIVRATETAAVGCIRSDLAAALLCGFVGLVLSVAPHLAMFVRFGTLEFLGDGDDVYYLAVARAPYDGESSLRDPLSGSWESRPTLYAWLQFAPLALLTRWLGLSFQLIPLVWRAVGGPLLGLSLYLLFRRILAGANHPTRWSLGCALICLADAGFSGGQSVFGSLTLLNQLAQGTTPLPKPDALGQYRVVTPLLNLQALLVLAAVIVPPLSGRRSVMALIAGILALAACVHLYFFFWTAAVVGVGLWLIPLAIWAWKRECKSARRELVFVLLILAGGLAIGSPQVLSNSRTFADPALKPILRRMSRGLVLPLGDPARSRYLNNSWVLAKLALGAAAIFFLGSQGRRLAPIWTFTAAGYLLANSAIVTGLEFENAHWSYVHATFGEVLLLSVVSLLLDRRDWGRRMVLAIEAVPAGLVILALIWRPYEALRAPEAIALNATLRALQPLRSALARLGPVDILAGPRETNIALILSHAGQLYEFDQTMVSSLIPDAQLHERNALNAWLRGLSLEEYLLEISNTPLPALSSTDPAWRRDALAATRSAIFIALEAGRSAELLDRYRPSALLRLSNLGPPPRGGEWRSTADSSQWTLWRRTRPSASR